MIFSRSSEYAIRACVHLASLPDGGSAMAREIAQAEDIPSHFLAKILQQLARKEVLRSSKGPGGGFSLKAAPGELTLLDIIRAIDGMESYERCVIGLAECSDAGACPMHQQWSGVRSRIIGYLGHCSVGELARRSKARPAAKRASRRAVAGS